MLFFVVHLVLLILAFFCLGLPISQRLTEGKATGEVIFWAILVGLAAVSFVWVIDISLNGGGKYAISLLCVYILSAFSVAFLKTRRKQTKQPFVIASFDKKTTTADLIFCLALTVLAALPTIESVTQYSTPVRVGPDAVGNAVAARAIADGISIRTIERDVIRDTGSKDLSEVLEFETHRLYETTDLRTQIRTEFLVAGLRWGYPSISGTLMKILPGASPWSLIQITTAMGLFLVAIGAISLARNLKAGTITCWAYTAICAISPIILNSWHEGGSSQILALPVTLAVLLILVDKNCPRREHLVLSTIALSFGLVTYSDLWILCALLMSLFGATALALKRLSLNDCMKIAFVLVASTVLMLPFSWRFVPYLSRRLSDASIGGWSLPHWLSPPEILGIVNAFNQSAPTGLEPRGNLATLANSLLTPVLVGAGVGLTFKTQNWRLRLVWLSATAIVCSFYFKTRFIDQVTNYQYFKVAGCLLAAFCLPILLIRSTSSRRMSFSVATLGVSALICALVWSSLSYVRTFRGQSQIIDRGETQIFESEQTRLFLSGINFFAPGTIQNMALAASTQFNWLGRGAFFEVEGTRETLAKPLYLMIREADCIEWNCLKSLDRRLIREVTPKIRFVKLAPDSGAVLALKARGSQSTELWTVADSLFTDAGGIGIDPAMRPNRK